MTSANMTNNKNSWMVLLQAETAIHAGAGDGSGLIDLPIMREVQNNWPCVYGSAMKGAIRAKVEPHGLLNKANEGLLNTAFGQDGGEGAGRLLVGDARILALPVRSLNMPTVKITCVAVLNRFLQDAKRLGLVEQSAALPDKLSSFRSMGAENRALGSRELVDSLDKGTLYLEEHRFQVTAWNEALEPLLALLPALDDMLIVRDDIFSHLCTNAVPVTPRIRIDSKTGTVVDGALWYEESLPADALLYWPLSLSPLGRKSENSADIAHYVRDVVLGQGSKTGTNHQPATAPYVQIGGNETVGMGWCAMSLLLSDSGEK